MDYSIEGIEVTNPESLAEINLRARRLNRTCQVVIGNCTFRPPISTHPEQFFVLLFHLV